MPVPSEYNFASMHFEKFMIDARDVSGLKTTHMAWNMVVGVLYTFRRRLSVNDAIRFANVLPPVVRAIFVSDWDLVQEILPFQDIKTMTDEVKSLRKEHNFSLDTAIQDTATALRRNVDLIEFDKILLTLTKEAQEYWQVKENHLENKD
ncbi:MAG: DUF2267 domain-containing protein [Desulfobacterales bacterium]|nr:DUF2267 domain-containing protein [Desulfobacterales bacterium]MCP4161659.1 DUF2267 domain-containing protein [Deltaproteobacteria bacterium]